MEKLKFYKILVIILVLLNIGTLATIWLGRWKESGLHNRRDENEPLLKEMKLSEEQRKDFREQRRVHIGQLRFMQSEERQLHEKFFDMVFSGNQDSNQVLRMIDSMLLVRKEMELMTYRHFKKIQGLLDPGQRAIFRRNFGSHFNEVMPPPRPLKDIPEPPPPPPIKHN